MSVPDNTRPDHAAPQLVEYPDLFPGRLFLDHTKWHGVPVTLSTLLPDGQVLALGTPTKQFIIGSRPMTTVEFARYEARWRVQIGLSDVMHWLGLKVLPMPPVTGAEILEGIRRGIV